MGAMIGVVGGPESRSDRLSELIELSEAELSASMYLCVVACE